LQTHLSHLFIASGIFHPEQGGPATYLHELLPELQTRGWDIRALTYGNGSTAGYPYSLTRIPRRTLPLRMAQYALAARPLLGWADLVYMHTLGLPLIGGRGIPRIVKIVGDQGWERAVRRGWIAPTEDIDEFQHKRYGMAVTVQVRAMDGVIVPSAYLKRMVIGWGVDERKVYVIYNALPQEPAADVGTQHAVSDALAQLNLEDAPLILTAARLLPWKGVDHLITALQLVPDVRLLVAGEGQMTDEWTHLAEQLGLSNRVTFLGRVPREKLALYMRAADYVALYSGYEGLSHTLLESLRVGTPVIASDKGGNPEVVQHGVNGLLVPYVDVEALAAALVEAFAPGRRAALAANTHVGLERLDFARMVEQTAGVLRSYV
jgi:glycosyltransferase involved in cell wall biosynthesis